MQYEVGALEFSYLFISLGRRREKGGGGGCPILQVQVYYLSTKRTYFLLLWGVGVVLGPTTSYLCC